VHAHSAQLKSLQQQRSTKHTNRRQRTASHSRRRSSRAFRSRTASRASRRARHRARCRDANTIARARLHTSAGAGGHGSRNDRRSGRRSLATRPSCPRRIRSAPGTFGPTTPGRSRARRTAPPACPGTLSPGS
jgi:hypothetical protein